jgi:hypothetical protein
MSKEGVVPERMRILTEAEATTHNRLRGKDIQALYAEGYAVVCVHSEDVHSFSGRGQWIDGVWWPWLPWRLWHMVPSYWRGGRHWPGDTVSQALVECWLILRARP